MMRTICTMDSSALNHAPRYRTIVTGFTMHWHWLTCMVLVGDGSWCSCNVGPIHISSDLLALSLAPHQTDVSSAALKPRDDCRDVVDVGFLVIHWSWKLTDAKLILGWLVAVPHATMNGITGSDAVFMTSWLLRERMAVNLHQQSSSSQKFVRKTWINYIAWSANAILCFAYFFFFSVNLLFTMSVSRHSGNFSTWRGYSPIRSGAIPISWKCP